MKYTIKRVFEHYEVFDDGGNFLFSADSHEEALEELCAGSAA